VSIDQLLTPPPTKTSGGSSQSNRGIESFFVNTTVRLFRYRRVQMAGAGFQPATAGL
jgi:hypothetical protein